MDRSQQNSHVLLRSGDFALTLKRMLVIGAAFTMFAAMVMAPAYATGFLTTESAYITLDAGVPSGSSVKALISSGDVIGDFTFEGLPDGIGIKPGDEPGTVEVYVAHEQTTVPFFSSADFQDASVSHLTLSTAPDSMEGAVLGAVVAISPDDGYLRFCSASMAGPDQGFTDYVFFTGEEANDILDVSPGAPYGSDPGIAPQRQAGYAIGLNTSTDESTPIPGLGRLNHENVLALPGWDKIVMLTTDDTFSGPSAQLYMYLANNQNNVLNDKGSMWAFRVTETDDGKVDRADAFNDANDYLDIQPGDNWKGEFIRVPKEIARGQTGVAPQQALEDWSNENNVFQFIRLEDLAYDKNDPRVVYVADTGRTRVVPDEVTGRMMRGPGGTVGQADNGRVFRFEFDDNNPRKVVGFSVFADGDAPSSDVYVPFVNPDNMDTSTNSLMIQEDHDNARIWQHDFTSGTWAVVATVNDPNGESSGIVDASEWFGPGSWILDVQGHGANVDEAVIDGILFKRESGQVMLMKIPGS